MHTEFLQPELPLDLQDSEIHVWCISLAITVSNTLLALLSTDEQARARRFRFEKDKNSFIAARANLRKILALYLPQAPENIAFIYNKYGKPELVLDPGLSLQFNLSHSHELALCAVTREYPVGIDIEYLRNNLNIQELSARFFAEREHHDILSLSEGEQLQAFFNVWTRKEAYLKAMGKGITFPLDKVVVSSAPNQAAILQIDGDEALAQNWSLASFQPASDYIAAVAMPAKIKNIHFYQLQQFPK